MAGTAFLPPIFIMFFASPTPIPTHHHQVALFSFGFLFYFRFIKAEATCWQVLLSSDCVAVSLQGPGINLPVQPLKNEVNYC